MSTHVTLQIRQSVEHLATGGALIECVWLIDGFAVSLSQEQLLTRAAFTHQMDAVHCICLHFDPNSVTFDGVSGLYTAAIKAKGSLHTCKIMQIKNLLPCLKSMYILIVNEVSPDDKIYLFSTI
jgi:hypothetical protein